MYYLDSLVFPNCFLVCAAYPLRAVYPLCAVCVPCALPVLGWGVIPVYQPCPLSCVSLCLFPLQVSLSGPADPLRVQSSGTLNLDAGALNLVATQFVLDREHANRIVFQPELGLDPIVDVLMLSGDLRAAIQVGDTAASRGL